MKWFYHCEVLEIVRKEFLLQFADAGPDAIDFNVHLHSFS